MNSSGQPLDNEAELLGLGWKSSLSLSGDRWHLTLTNGDAEIISSAFTQEEVWRLGINQAKSLDKLGYK